MSIDDDMELYRCTECGWVCRAEPEGAIGKAHVHAEKHTGFLSYADVETLDKIIETVTVQVHS